MVSVDENQAIQASSALNYMSQDHTLMASRYELKYLISSELALQVRDFVRQYLELDEYSVGQPNDSYPIHSVYLDSDDWKIYQRTINGDKNRFKLRIRYYTENRKVPIFFEIKRRMKDVILKQRAGVRADAVQELLNGQMPLPEQLINPCPEDFQAIQDFQRLMLELNAKPKMQVSYDREAYVNNFNNEVRLTLDRNVRGVPRDVWIHTTQTDGAFICTKDVVILELKFTHRFPIWYRDLVETFNLPQCGAAKYVESTSLYQGRNRPEIDIIRGLVL